MKKHELAAVPQLVRDAIARKGITIELGQGFEMMSGKQVWQASVGESRYSETTQKPLKPKHIFTLVGDSAQDVLDNLTKIASGEIK